MDADVDAVLRVSASRYALPVSARVFKSVVLSCNRPGCLVEKTVVAERMAEARQSAAALRAEEDRKAEVLRAEEDKKAEAKTLRDARMANVRTAIVLCIGGLITLGFNALAHALGLK